MSLYFRDFIGYTRGGRPGYVVLEYNLRLHAWRFAGPPSPPLDAWCLLLVVCCLLLAAWSLRLKPLQYFSQRFNFVTGLLYHLTSEDEAQRQLFTGIPGPITVSSAHWSQVPWVQVKTTWSFTLNRSRDQGSASSEDDARSVVWHWIDPNKLEPRCSFCKA